MPHHLAPGYTTNGATMTIDPIAFLLGFSLMTNVLLARALWLAYRDRHSPPF